MKYTIPLLLSVVSSLSALANPLAIDSTIRLHGKIFDMTSRNLIQTEVSVTIFYNSDFVKDDSCQTVRGEFTFALTKPGWYILLFTAQSYFEATDTLWVLSFGRALIEREYFMSLKNPVPLASTSPEGLQLDKELNASINRLASSVSSIDPGSTTCIYFAFGKSTLPRQYQSKLDSLATYLKENPTIVFEVAGHTDGNGQQEYNLQLSKWRAQSVVQYLIDHGVSSTQLIAQAYGESIQLNGDDTNDGRARNRRVELPLAQLAN